MLSSYDATPNRDESLKRALHGEVQGWIEGIMDIVAYLPPAKDPAATEEYFYSVQAYLTDIGVTLQRYMEIERHRFNAVFRSSERVRKLATPALKKVFAVAELFEGYQRKPTAYKQPKSKGALESAVNHLINLRNEVLPPQNI